MQCYLLLVIQFQAQFSNIARRLQKLNVTHVNEVPTTFIALEALTVSITN